MVDIEKLKVLAEAANAVIGDVRIHADMESQMGSKEEAEAVMGVMVAANPAAVLELISENERFKAERDQLRAEVEALRKDAERYRWLRKGESDDVAVVRGLGAMDYGMSAVAYTHSEEIDGDDLDAAIDAAMAAKEEV